MSEQTMALIMNLLPFVILIVFFYFVIIKPQKKREKQTREMLAALKVGDEIVTIGGVVGRIVTIKDEVITIEVGADRVKIPFERSAIRNVQNS